MQLIGDARCLHRVNDPTGQPACLEFGNKQAVGTLWQSVIVDGIDFAVIDDDANKQFGELLGKRWIEVGQFLCQFIAYSLGQVIGHLPTCILFHPPHYTAHPSGVECITITEHMGFCLGNAVKYIWRADLKANVVEDLEKARWYIDREIARRRSEDKKCHP
jgi:hypothetical protein